MKDSRSRVQELQDKLPFISLRNLWSIWSPNKCSLIIMSPSFQIDKIQVDMFSLVEFDLSIKCYLKGEVFQFPSKFPSTIIY